MTITCPHCGFSAEVSPAQIPAGATEATCPRCKAAFEIQPETKADLAPADQTHDVENTVTCPACGHQQPAGSYCLACGIDYAKWQKRQAQAEPETEEAQVSCPFCGNTQQPATYCQRCGGVLSTAAAVAVGAYAGFWIRTAAAIVDSIAVWLLQMVLTLVLGAMAGLLTPNAGDDSFAAAIMLMLFSCAISIAYYVVFTGACGQTPGKMLLRVKVIRTDGSSLTYGRAALREVVGKFVSGIILGVGYLMVAFDGRKQGLHDKIADTLVIRV